jgi:hypothetical protein
MAPAEGSAAAPIAVVTPDEYRERLSQQRRSIEHLTALVENAPDAAERARLSDLLEAHQAYHADTQRRVEALERREALAARAEPPPTIPATAAARGELDRLEQAGEVEPWLADHMRGVLMAVESAILEQQTSMAEVLRAAVAETAEFTRARAEERRELSIQERINEWSKVKFLKRSQLSAKPKSWIIRTFGRAAYESLRA